MTAQSVCQIIFLILLHTVRLINNLATQKTTLGELNVSKESVVESEFVS